MKRKSFAMRQMRAAQIHRHFPFALSHALLLLFFSIYHRCRTLTVFLQVQLLPVLDVKFKETRQQTLVDFIGINTAIRTHSSSIA